MSRSQLAIALLFAGLMISLFAVRFGRLTENLNRLVARLRHEKFTLANMAHLKSLSLPFYLTAALDLSLALILASGEDFGMKLLVGGGVALGMGLATLWEQNKGLAWLCLGLVVAGIYQVCVKVGPNNAALVLALAALGLNWSGYGLESGVTRLLALPSKIAGHILAASAVLWWLSAAIGRVYANALNPLSWLLGLLGLIYLSVSLLEMRRQPLNRPEALPWRYVSYGSILLIEAWFSLQLALGSVGQLQFYVIPLGLILLVFGWQERNGHNPRLTSLLEGLGLILLLGTTLLQAFGLQTLGLDKAWYGLGLLVEALLIIGFGAVERWRYYFFGGMAAIMLDLVALLLEPVRAADKWLVLGLVGLALIGLALFLERKRDSVILLSKSWRVQLRQWE